MIKIEIWKDVKGYKGLYQVSSFGRVKSLDRIIYQKNKHNGVSKCIRKGKILSLQKQINRYLTIDLHYEKKVKRYFVHRLVAETFIQKHIDKNYINHIDSNPLNNKVENLEWCTQSYNIKYAYDNGNKIPPHMIKIAQYSMDGQFIKLWNSQSIIERELGIFQANIYKVCSGKRKTAGGYIWKYAV